MAKIDFVDLAHSYSAPTTEPGSYALKHVTMTWRQGGAYALLGPSGCGKTTLLNIVSGLITPSTGRILFDGVDVTRLPTEKRNIAQVFQFPVIYDTMTVAQNLGFPLKNRKVPPDQIARRVCEIADMLDLTDVLERKATGLTADAKQKISLGRGLVRADVAAILFDEPLTVIDPHLKWQLRSKLKALHRALDMTMIYVTHDQTEALTFADTIVVMHDGRIVQSGTPAELFERPEHTFVGHFIGSPGMNFLSVKIDGSVARIGEQSFSLAVRYPSISPQKNVELGIRPEFALLTNGPDGLRVQVDRIDNTGRARIARVRLGERKMAVTVPDGLQLAGTEAFVRLNLSKIHIYADSKRVESAHG